MRWDVGIDLGTENVRMAELKTGEPYELEYFEFDFVSSRRPLAKLYAKRELSYTGEQRLRRLINFIIRAGIKS